MELLGEAVSVGGLMTPDTCVCVVCVCVRACCVHVCVHVCVCEDHYFRSAKTATVLFLSRLNRSTCSRLNAMVIMHMLTISVLNACFGCVLTSMFKNAKCMFMI